MQMIEVNGLFHSYAKNEDYAVNDVSFSIGKGEILGFQDARSRPKYHYNFPRRRKWDSSF